MIDRSTTYEIANAPLWLPCATSPINTASAKMASIAPKYASRSARSSVSKRLAYAVYPCHATYTGMKSAAKRRKPPAE
jgi:hypothetical protein